MGGFWIEINFSLLLLVAAVLFSTKVHAENDLNGLTACELEQIARQIIYPENGFELHRNALRSQLKSLLDNYVSQDNGIQSYDNQQNDDDDDYDDAEFDSEKRSLSALARNGAIHANSPNGGKRNVAAMARLGMMRQSIADESKRSIATLAKNGQLPSREPETEDLSESQWSDFKRNIGSLARSGNIASGKRNVGSLARDFLLPTNGKRNLQSILRSGGGSSSSGQQHQPKRNVAALARDNLYPYYHQSRNEKRDVTSANNKPSSDENKRNIGSMKNSPVHGGKLKRDITYDDFPDESEIVSPVYQTAPLNYDELRYAMNELYPNYGSADILNEKRYLGSVVRDGWSSSYRPQYEKRNIGSLARQGLLRSDISSYLNQKQYRQQEDKRHLGAVARSGWLPAFRSIRGGRFSRSGRARSRTGGFYPQHERPHQPIAAVCERCRQQQQSIYPNPISWAAPGLSHWGTPPRLTAVQQRSFRGPFHPNGDYF